VCLEVNGGQWVKSAHSSGRGLRRDAEKQNAAVISGWRPIVVTADMVADGSGVAALQAALQSPPARA
jgi:hypothetical protein